MRNIAIVKPDHLGDLVLASPTINWLKVRARAATLFVQRSNLALARFLFPDIRVEALTLPHLHKGDTDAPRSLAAGLAPLSGHDVSVFLRADHVLSRARVAHIVGQCIFTDPEVRRHETVNHRYGVRPYFGEFSSDAHWTGSKRPFPGRPKVVGLCIGSGFPTNKWSVIRWTELARALLAEGVGIRLIGGPQEREELAILAEVARVPESDVIVGSPDVAAFLDRVRETDVVIASDGGAGHLCSLAAPVLTIAGSVPFRRFAPFGAEARVVSLDLPCSPCLNAHDTHINMCFSHECSYGITAAHVLAALGAASEAPGASVPLGGRARVFFGVSHAA